MSGSYIRYVDRSNFKPFNPLELAMETEKIVCSGMKRKYDRFAILTDSEGHTQISAWASGCCLRCVFCWGPYSRDFPERYGEFYSPEEVLENLLRLARQANLSPYKTSVSISGGESTLAKKHLVELAFLVQYSGFQSFSIDTNGVLLGHDEDYIDAFHSLTKITFRLSLKAGTPEGFQKRTGAEGRFYELPFKGISNIGRFYAPRPIPLSLWAMTDQRIMSKVERQIMVDKLKKINVGLPEFLREETVCPYRRSLVRLRKAGVNIQFTKDERAFVRRTPF